MRRSTRTLVQALAVGVVALWGTWAGAAPISFETIVLSGDTAPGTGGTAFSFLSGSVELNDGGDTAFFGVLTGAGVTSGNDRGIFKESGGSLGLVAREGDTAPGTGGAAFSFLTGPALNDGGDTAFIGRLAGAGVTRSNDGGIFKESGGSLALVAREGDTAPGTGGAAFSRLTVAALNDRGDTAFRGRLSGGGVNTPDVGIFKESGGSLGLVAREGDTAPGTGGAAFTLLGGPALNDRGDTAFYGQFIGAGVARSNNLGIFKESGGSLGLVARDGDTAPGTGGAAFSFVTDAVELNDGGDIAFFSRLTGAGVTASNDVGIFKESGGSLGLVAREGDTAPGTGGAMFSTFASKAHNNRGDTALVSRLTGAGVMSSNDSGIWFGPDGGPLDLILREGDLLEVAPGDQRTVNSIGLFGLQGGFLNDVGQIASEVGFTDGTQGLFVASMNASPQPTESLEQLSLSRSIEYDIQTNNPGFRDDLPTVIITHGRQPDVEYTGRIDAIPRLNEMYDAIESEYGDEVNIIAVTWEGAFFGTEILGIGFEDFTMVSDAERAGRALGAELSFSFKQKGYSEPIHFIGHSYGSVVNREAALKLASDDVSVAQFTMLDAPVDAPVTGPSVENGLVPLIRNQGIEYIESYYGTQPTNFNVLGGPIENTARDDGYVYNTDHSGVFDEYIATIPNKFVVEARGGFFLSPAIDGFSFQRPDDGRGAMTPLLSAPILEDSISESAASNFDPLSGSGTVSTASDGFLVFEILLPESAIAVSFNLIFDQPGDGDFLELQFGDELLGVFDGRAYQTESNVVVDVLGLGGRQGFLSFLLINEGSQASSLRFSNLRVLSEPRGPDVIPVPLPASLSFLFGGVVVLGLLRMRQRTATIQGSARVLNHPELSGPAS